MDDWIQEEAYEKEKFNNLIEPLRENSTLCLSITEDLSDKRYDMICTLLLSNTSVSSLSITKTFQYTRDGPKVIAKILKSLNRPPHLETIVINNCYLKDEGVQQVCAFLMENSSVISLDLSRNAFGPIGAESLAKMLRENQSIRMLDVNNNKNLQEQGGIHLAEALKTNSTLKKLNLSSCRCGDGAVFAIADSLLLNQSLEKVYLWDFGVTKSSIDKLFKSLMINTTLTKLYLGNNLEIGNDGAKVISQCVNKTHIKTLSLSQCNIGDDGMSHLSDALRENHTLRSLDLDDNPFSDIGLATLFQAVIQANSLKKLSIAKHMDKTPIKLPSKLLADFIGANCSVNKLTFLNEKSWDLANIKYYMDSIRINTNIVTYHRLIRKFQNQKIVMEVMQINQRNGAVVKFKEGQSDAFPFLSQGRSKGLDVSFVYEYRDE